MAKKGNSTLAVIALLLNIFTIPGLGSIIGGKTKEGVLQLVLVAVAWVIGFPLTFIIIGLPIWLGCWFAAWIWGIVTGVQLIKESS